MPKRKSNSTTSAAAKSTGGGNEDSNSEGDDAGDDDEATVLWKKLQETQRKKMKHLEDETEQLQHEKDTMLNSVMVASAASPGGNTTTTIRDNDIIEIDAGGKILRALRSTLTLPSNTMWSYMFSGRWDESLKRDSDGRIFLDYDYDLIEIIVNHFREKKIEDPSNPVKSPYVPPHKKESFQRLLQYFGLVDYFNPSSPPTTMTFSKTNLVQYEGTDFAVTENDNKTVKLVYKVGGLGAHYGVACTDELDPSGEGCFWKVNIDSLPSSGGFFLGILGNLNLKYYIPGEATSFGWDGNYVDGECLYFHFKSNKLSMHSVQKNQTFIIDDDMDTSTTKYYFHIINCVYNNTIVTLGPLDAEERKVFTDEHLKT